MSRLNADYLDREALEDLGFAELGENVRIHSSVVIADCSNVHIRDNVRIDPFAIITSAQGIELGNYVHVAAHCTLAGSERIVFEDFAGISQGVKIYSSSDDYSGRTLTNPTTPSHLKSVTQGDVRLGRHCIIGAGSVVLPGLEIGTGTAVGALSLVDDNLDEWGIYAGVPARYLLPRLRDLVDLEKALDGR